MLGTTILGNPHIKKKKNGRLFGSERFEPGEEITNRQLLAEKPWCCPAAPRGGYAGRCEEVLEGKVLGYTGFPQKNNMEYIRNHQSLSVVATHWIHVESVIFNNMFVQRVLKIMKLPILVVDSLSWFHSMTRKISGTKGPKQKETNDPFSDYQQLLLAVCCRNCAFRKVWAYSVLTIICPFVMCFFLGWVLGAC